MEQEINVNVNEENFEETEITITTPPPIQSDPTIVTTTIKQLKKEKEIRQKIVAPHLLRIEEIDTLIDRAQQS